MSNECPAYLDPATGAAYPLHEPRWRSDSGGPLMVSPLPGISRSQIASGARSIWRYAAALPFEIVEPVTMGEGCTPLARCRWHGTPVFMKLEWFAPTGSFKDRGASVLISALRQQGVSAIVEDSSGNGGAAIAAYAAACGMTATILAPASTPVGKTVPMRAYGAAVDLIPGTRQDTTDEAERRAATTFYASHNWHPLFLQGTKTLAYELWEDLGFRAPDNVIIPTGAGSNVLGLDIGFSELLRRGEIGRRPRLFAAQPANCAPIHAAFEAGTETPVETAVRPTMAEGTAIARPVRLREVLQAVRRSNGRTVAVSEDEIAAAVMDLGRIGLFAEPTSAVAAAAFSRLLRDGRIAESETTVILLTGSGLKTASQIGELIATCGSDGARVPQNGLAGSK